MKQSSTENTVDPGQRYPGSSYFFGQQPMPSPKITADPAANAMPVAVIPPTSNPPSLKVGPPAPNYFTADKE
jgi:hypothetical protein